MKKIVLQLFYRVIMRMFLKLTIGITYYDLRVLKQHRQFILIANHNSHLDTMALMAAMPADMLVNVHPVAASDYFGNSKWKAMLSGFFINALLIPRKRPEKDGDPDPIALMEEALRQGKSLIVFPEGTRGIPEVMQPFRKGIGVLIQRFPSVPVLPVYLQGLGKCLPKGEKVFVPFNASVHFGAPSTLNYSTPERIAYELESSVKKISSEKKIICHPKLIQEATSFENALLFLHQVRLTQIKNNLS